MDLFKVQTLFFPHNDVPFFVAVIVDFDEVKS